MTRANFTVTQFGRGHTTDNFAYHSAGAGAACSSEGACVDNLFLLFGIVNAAAHRAWAAAQLAQLCVLGGALPRTRNLMKDQEN